MGSRLALVIVCSVLFSLIGTSAATGKTGRITSKLYSTVILSFLNNFGSGKYGLNLAGHSWAAVGPDVTYCQSKKVLVLLTIGGGIGKYSLASKADAKADAKAVAKAVAKTGRLRLGDRLLLLVVEVKGRGGLAGAYPPHGSAAFRRTRRGRA
nr:xylanase inhibitor protein 1-like [Lolium perenne]